MVDELRSAFFEFKEILLKVLDNTLEQKKPESVLLDLQSYPDIVSDQVKFGTAVHRVLDIFLMVLKKNNLKSVKRALDLTEEAARGKRNIYEGFKAVLEGIAKELEDKGEDISALFDSDKMSDILQNYRNGNETLNGIIVSVYLSHVASPGNVRGLKTFDEAMKLLREEYMPITRFEKSRIVGARALQISYGAPILIDYPEDMLDPIDIALMEFDKDLIPISVYKPDENTV